MIINQGLGNIIGSEKQWDMDNTMGGIGMAIGGLLIDSKHPLLGIPVALWGAITFFRLL